MSSKLKRAIGQVKDQTSISLAKVSNNATSNLEIAVLKATSHDEEPIDEKYVSEVVEIVSSNKINAAACARAIGKRIGRTRNWIVALKSLMLVLRLFQDGDPYFPREVLHAMKKGAKILNLVGFRDDSNSIPWDFTAFVRTFALYLDERLECFITGKLQRRYKHRGLGLPYDRSKNLSARRLTDAICDMKPTVLLDKMSNWQRLLDRAIALRPTGEAKTNNLVQESLYAIVQESFDLYKDISDGLGIVLDSFFHLQYQNCVAAFQTCLKAVKQFEELSAFYSLCKSIGVGRSSEYPTVQVISEELIESLHEFLKDQSLFSPTAVTPRSPIRIKSSFAMNNRFSMHAELSPSSARSSTRASDCGSPCTSLEELINATETTQTGIVPAISIDLETYSEPKCDSMTVSETGSTRSLPISTSIGDLMSLDDWMDCEKKDEPKQQQGHIQSAVLDYSSPPSSLSQSQSENIPNTFNAFSEQPPLKSNEKPSTTMDASSNNWDLTLFQSSVAMQTENPSPSTAGWELTLFKSSAGNPNCSIGSKNSSTTGLEGPQSTEKIPRTQMTPMNHYNPFLEDPIQPYETLKNQNQTSLPPTFKATPTFSVEGMNQKVFDEQNMKDDPFAEVSVEQKLDPQNLLLQQQLWLQNQSRILGKNRS